MCFVCVTYTKSVKDVGFTSTKQAYELLISGVVKHEDNCAGENV